MTDTNRPEPDDDVGQADLRQGAALFLGQALGLNETPEELSADLSPIKRDVNASIFTIQLDSTVGLAAFLVYAYVLDARGGDGRTGKELFDSGLDTLREAAQRNTPGPRALAHAESGDFGYILATTPGTYRALTGESAGGESRDTSPTTTYSVEEALELRGEAATQLLESLRTANDNATRWLDAVRISSDAEFDAYGVEEMLEFTDRETELALFLLDEASISDLLHALNVLVSTAQEQAAAIRDDAP